ncbi:uncharacterized protein EURHEDRAFT_417961 [Aspergillus ruber CBS 135680]|uniref:Uncharacterized protein n=1 Tax=Aspergillus ruber (strain CBS 135680) TaxID=1388766 RepID=A0A017RYS7_ASPRC|nr:uncharacterized protein EURHEDRAFT_417961 [Aspergillus ruber CBS 135680]EYE89938.1 hypothetical protein EURHEDRAFT_417961 [Aspergillus ruber CBS 135680]
MSRQRRRWLNVRSTCNLMRSDRSDQRNNVSPTSEPPIYGQRSPHIESQALIKHSSTRVL